MLRVLFRSLRPKQWPKNILVFAGLFFDGQFLVWSSLLSSIAGFVIFCLVSSAIYLINDMVDIEKDRQHPTKRYRPLASGALSVRTAMSVAAGILILCVPAAFALDLGFGATIAAYIAITLLYDFVLKEVVIIDVMAIATGFVLRVVAGTVLVHVARFSPWLYLCTILLSLFFAINKRRNELLLLAENANNHRAILQEYSIAFLDDMSSLVTAAALVAYSFYTFSAPNLPSNHSMMLTIPFVLYCIFRYMYLVHTKGMGGAPEEIVLGDRSLIIGALLWAITAGLVIYAPVFLGG